jgi:hypothetical protein
VRQTVNGAGASVTARIVVDRVGGARLRSGALADPVDHGAADACRCGPVARCRLVHVRGRRRGPGWQRCPGRSRHGRSAGVRGRRLVG